ncbi:MAG: oxygen-independent coproporphyrinogen III oxidase [gamma proteobacterium symbiont of Bathyaustriella thionipta]|nr:oxygen-independent coproporphyrinogen III oxidase [gamma proteobacterium symbiont of Bathyaustriella thionipta]MCU7949820.1 oxygen-independent coproporphyrinogen III oxidase [gamma proteobacterium symbiont of Bathyaustriella thionipta]MCU7951876.1 oxygen-independent coproporphyrinogen III oxidase [gamma proteobacterium symbiont of Bathyaustriella thionipta]MCU7956677.1 oxygen-independent coproporphyrinogen III oxidase [gamma proteobacterium symbiont of Bathyaustriella thionipta]MCU7966448.1 
MMANVEFDPQLIKRYDKAGPRYTSYPTAVQFGDEYTADTYKKFAEKSNQSGQALSLYFHIPFCDTVCFYCGCNKVVTKDRSKAAPYLDRVYKEIEMQAKLFDPSRKVDQLHWGGGTPTFISHDEMRELMTVTRKHFNLHDDDSGEYSIEIDPREVSRDSIKLLRELGFNRMSLGVQDFNPAVQKAVNRIQSREETLAALTAAREENFKSISVDLIYGLPLQTVESFDQTLDELIEISPDRVSVFNYAHLPERFKPQRRINEDELPPASVKLEIFKHCMEKLTNAGYVYIGMDHFAKQDDELTIAQNNGKLYRNFQGYATHADCDLVGIGITSIGTIANSFAQNVRTMDEYYEKIDQGELAIFRGVEIDNDDLIRREAIMQLICHFKLNFNDVEKHFNINFNDYFSVELERYKTMVNDGLITMDERSIEVTSRGRLLIRNICMVFDRYIKPDEKTERFSKLI